MSNTQDKANQITVSFLCWETLLRFWCIWKHCLQWVPLTDMSEHFKTKSVSLNFSMTKWKCIDTNNEVPSTHGLIKLVSALKYFFFLLCQHTPGSTTLSRSGRLLDPAVIWHVWQSALHELHPLPWLRCVANLKCSTLAGSPLEQLPCWYKLFYARHIRKGKTTIPKLIHPGSRVFINRLELVSYNFRLHLFAIIYLLMLVSRTSTCKII